MLQNDESVRCKCGRQMNNLRLFCDSQTQTEFLTERCRDCGVIRADQVRSPSHV